MVSTRQQRTGAPVKQDKSGRGATKVASSAAAAALTTAAGEAGCVLQGVSEGWHTQNVCKV